LNFTHPWSNAQAATRQAQNNCWVLSDSYDLLATWPNGIQRGGNGPFTTESIDWDVATQQWLPTPGGTCWGINAKDGAWTMTYEVKQFWNESGTEEEEENPLP